MLAGRSSQTARFEMPSLILDRGRVAPAPGRHEYTTVATDFPLGGGPLAAAPTSWDGSWGGSLPAVFANELAKLGTELGMA